MFTEEDAHRYVSHFTSSQTFLAHVLPSLQLRMSRFDRVNDPRESRSWLFNLTVPDRVADQDWDVVGISERLTAFLKANAKLLCVTQDDRRLDPNRAAHLYGRSYAHPSMWDRYGDNHTGVALMLDIDELSTAVAHAANGKDVFRSPVSYSDMPASEHDAYTVSAADIDELGEQTMFAQHLERHHGALFFWKSSDWASEVEYRWVLVDGGPGEVFVDISTALSGVIFGEAFPQAAIGMVRDRLGNGLQYAQMRYRNGHPIVMPVV